MRRILDPLEAMGIKTTDTDGRLPVSLTAPDGVASLSYRLPVASAQVKSAVLLAALGAPGETVIEEPVPSRDHTENLLQAFGVKIRVETTDNGNRITLAGRQSLSATEVSVPGDPSSAAFAVAAAAIIPGSDVTVDHVLLNPLRTGFFTTLREMGADLAFDNECVQNGECIGDVRVRGANLSGVTVPEARAASMIDEYPILAVVAAFARGETHMPGIGELRVKESDRIAACVAGLEANGVAVSAGEDWMRVIGDGQQPRGGATVVTHHDHRIAMSFLIMGLAAQSPVSIDDPSMIATSFPTFFELMRSLGAQFS